MGLIAKIYKQLMQLTTKKKKPTKLTQSKNGKWCESHSVMSDSLRSHGFYSPWSSGGSGWGGRWEGGSGWGRHVNPRPFHFNVWQNSLQKQTNKQTNKRILEWVAFLFSRRSSKPRDWTQVSHIAGGFFSSWATREAQRGEDLNRYFSKEDIQMP